jgi:hypothetical protein
MKDDFLEKKLQDRTDANALRSLKIINGKTDFCSNV